MGFVYTAYQFLCHNRHILEINDLLIYTDGYMWRIFSAEIGSAGPFQDDTTANAHMLLLEEPITVIIYC